MEPGNEEPFDRRPWRRLLDAESGSPARGIDRRILADARRALTPHIGRWWLPASLAASLLLAVLIAQWELSDSGAPVPVTESDVLVAPAPMADDEAAPAAVMEVPARRQEEAARPANSPPPPLMDLPILESRRAAAAPEIAGSTADTVATATPPLEPEQAGVTSALTPGMLKEKESHAESRTPEEWYAAIEALRTSGRIKEADAELARFKSEYPGWLESHQQQNP